MTDESDRATEREELFRAAALSAARDGHPALPFTGECHNCGAAIGRGCFCDADCRDDCCFRERQKMKRAR